MALKIQIAPTASKIGTWGKSVLASPNLASVLTSESEVIEAATSQPQKSDVSSLLLLIAAVSDRFSVLFFLQKLDLGVRGPFAALSNEDAVTRLDACCFLSHPSSLLSLSLLSLLSPSLLLLSLFSPFLSSLQIGVAFSG